MNRCSLLKERGGKWCSRRVAGLAGFAFCLMAVVMNLRHPLLEHILYTSAALIGLTTLDVFSGGKADK